MNKDKSTNHDIVGTIWENEKKSAWFASTTHFISNIRINSSLSEIKDNNNTTSTRVGDDVSIKALLNDTVIMLKPLTRGKKSSIYDWVMNQLVKPNFSSLGILRSVSRIRTKTSPIDYLKQYELALDLVVFFSNKIGIPIKLVQDNHLVNLPLLNEFIESTYWDYVRKRCMRRILGSLCLNTETVNTIMNRAQISKPRRESLSHPDIEAYIKSQIARGLRTVTLNTNRMYYMIFLRWLSFEYKPFSKYNTESIPLRQFTAVHLEDFKLHLLVQIKLEKLSQHKASDIFYEICAMFRVFYQMEIVPKDISNNVTPIPFKHYVYRDIPNDDEITSFFDAIVNYSPDPFYHQLAYALMLYMGLRTGEVKQLKWEYIDLESQQMFIYQSGRTNDIIHIPKKIAALMKSVTVAKEQSFVFDKKLDLYSYYTIFSRIAGWKFPGGPYLLRHTFVTKHSLNPNCTPQDLMKLARHKRPETTMLYVHRASRQLQSAINQINFN
ncbi:tyrosine-type recombinase/integrase [Paenibacillus alvei]|uniref:Site-specific integrase n=1 Tax=Paenibacillus alvei TaxID=44250 RepID=A0AAP7DKM1_PAEAL|nr:site-specific integrase [Paenibacillus alvei]NOJ73120.1 site-specific integrase [Paenibacillus alvei]